MRLRWMPTSPRGGPARDSPAPRPRRPRATPAAAGPGLVAPPAPRQPPAPLLAQRGLVGQRQLLAAAAQPRVRRPGQRREPPHGREPPRDDRRAFAAERLVPQRQLVQASHALLDPAQPPLS